MRLTIVAAPLAAMLAAWLDAAPGQAASYAQVYAFKGGADGVGAKSLIAANGMLYGTTTLGGDSLWDGGTVYSLSTSGAHTVLHKFAGASDGAFPDSVSLIGGAIYGTSAYYRDEWCGVHGGCGAIFTVNADGSDWVVTFRAQSEGAQYAGAGLGPLVVRGDNLWGVTELGGAHGYGTLFHYAPGGKIKVVYSFGGGTDGANPVGSLVLMRGVLYGTSLNGGGAGCGGFGCGTIFSWSEHDGVRVLYRFKGGSDGSHPQGNMVVDRSMLHGTTVDGGGYTGFDGNARNGAGTVFRFDPGTETETVLHAFRGGPKDGQGPTAKLAVINHTLYGTTTLGGPKFCVLWGCGVVFSLSQGGHEKVLYSFTGGSDGFAPDNLVALNGVLYGTTYGGGASQAPFNGSVFSVTP